ESLHVVVAVAHPPRTQHRMAPGLRACIGGRRRAVDKRRRARRHRDEWPRTRNAHAELKPTPDTVPEEVDMAWIYLIIAGLFEIGCAVGLKYTDGLTRLWPSVWTAASMAVSVVLLARALRD